MTDHIKAIIAAYSVGNVPCIVVNDALAKRLK